MSPKNRREPKDVRSPDCLSGEGWFHRKKVRYVWNGGHRTLRPRIVIEFSRVFVSMDWIREHETDAKDIAELPGSISRSHVIISVSVICVQKY
jgi:hypothetical protein